MTVLLKDALKPNLVQTLEGQPVMMHCGPFANIAHGNNSLIADLVGMKLGDYVVTESGFGSDMGMEKFFDIVCRFGKLTPSAAVLVTTVRAIKHHGGVEDDPRVDRAREHQGDRSRHGQRAPPPRDHPDVRRARGRRGQPSSRRHRRGGRAGQAPRARGGRIRRARSTRASRAAAPGAADLAEAVVEACEQPNNFHHLYADEAPIRDKIEAIATRVYGAKDVFFYPEAEQKIDQFTRDGLEQLPGVHGQDPPLAVGRPDAAERARRTSRCPVRDIRAYTGAGWLVPLCGDITQMPGLGKTPAALNVDIDADGRTVGLF